jgi:hypothetical protein
MLKEKSMSKQEKYMDWDNMNSSLEALFVLDNALTEPEDERSLLQTTMILNLIMIYLGNYILVPIYQN